MGYRFTLALLACLALAAPGWANDGFGGISATGLHFSRTDAVAMEEEDLFISTDEVRVAYVFRNRSDRDVTGEVIFPLPPIPVGDLLTSDWNLPDNRRQRNLVNFTATVDGRPVTLSQDRRAVLWNEMGEDLPPAMQYDMPGLDVTADLHRLGLPLTLDVDAIVARLMALPPEARAEVSALGLAEYYPSTEVPDEVWPMWSVILRYHWTQTFPANAVLRIAHSYDNRPPGGIFVWRHPPRDEWMRDLQRRFCIDDSTSRGIMKRLAGAMNDDGSATGMAWNIEYVLRTANSWAGPIGRFRLTLDKGSERHIISLCADGITKTGPTTFVMEKRNFVPDRDLQILIVSPLDN